MTEECGLLHPVRHIEHSLLVKVLAKLEGVVW